MKKISQNTSTLGLDVTIIREGESFIAYSPALDLSTVGDTRKKALRMFSEVVSLFFEELAMKGATDDVLLDLGWQRNGKRFIPPMIVSSQVETFSVPYLV